MSKKPLDLDDPQDLARLEDAAATVAYWIKHRKEWPAGKEERWRSSLERHIATLEGRLHPEWHTFHGEPPRERIPSV